MLAGDDGEIHVLSLPEGHRPRPSRRSKATSSTPTVTVALSCSAIHATGSNVDDEIYVVRSDGTRVRNLTDAPHSNEWGPAWSPDGTQIAFNSDREGIPQVYVMNADGTGLRRLSDVWGEYPAWSPDGDRIAFESYMGGTTAFGGPDYDVFVMNADGIGRREPHRRPEQRRRLSDVVTRR